MSCPACVESVENKVTLQIGSCEQELLDAIKSELFKTLAALPPHLQRYLSCRLGLAAPSALQKFDLGQLIAALPAIAQLLIQLGILPPPKGPSPAPAAQHAATTDAWLRGAILRMRQPFHEIGQIFTGAAEMGFDMSIFRVDPPAYEEILAVRAERQQLVTDFLDKQPRI